jgi:hypothetical protein
MIRSVFPSSAAVRLTAAAVALALVPRPAEAQVKPFAVVGGGPAPQGVSIFGADSPHSASGVGTFLGRYTGDQGVFNALSFDPVTGAGTFEGSFVFVAANGDKLACTYGDTDNGAAQPGVFQVVDAGGGMVRAIFLAEFNPVPAQSTGRFRNVVDGSFLMLAASEPFPLVIGANGFTPPFDYGWVGSGWLEFRRGR